MKFKIIFILLGSILTQQGFKQFFQNFQQQSQQRNNNDRNLMTQKSAKKYINELLPNGFQFIIEETNIDHYIEVQKKFHKQLEFMNQLSEGYILLEETSLELDQKIGQYYLNEQKKEYVKKLLPNDNDKKQFIQQFGSIRKHFKQCLLEIRTYLFTAKAIENCIGKDLSKINNSFNYQLRQYQAVKEQNLRQLFLKFCYQVENANPEDCDVIEKDMIDLLWENLSLSNNFRENRVKYEGLNGKISQQIFEYLLSVFIQFSEKNNEMYLFFKEIYEGFKLKLKEDIQKKEKTILEYEAPIKITEPSVYINTKVDLKQQYLDGDNYVSIDKLPSVNINKDPRLFNMNQNKDIEEFKIQYPNYDEENYPFKGLKGPKVTIPE